MAKGNSASDSAMSAAYPVFIDTNLNTHLAMIVSDEDSVRDLKNKIMIEHPLCFPNIGEITIHALKVKRKGCFYHLSDSMLIKSAFDGVNKTWFLYVNASSSQLNHKENRLCCDPGSSNLLANCIMNGPSAERDTLLPHFPSKNLSILDDPQLLEVGSSLVVNQKVPPDDQFGSGDAGREVSHDLNMEVRHMEDEHGKPSPHTNKSLNSEAQKKYDLVSKIKEVPRTHTKPMKDETKNWIRDMQCDNTLGEALQPMPVVKKRRKNEKKNEDAFYNSAGDLLKVNDAGTFIFGKEASKPETIIPVKSLENKQKNNTAISVGLPTKPSEDDHLFTTSLGGGKRKKKKRPSNQYDQVDSAVCSSVKNAREESYKEASESNNRNLAKESDAAIASEQSVQGATLSNPAINEKEKHCSPVQEVGEENMIPCSSISGSHVLEPKTVLADVTADSFAGDDMCEPDAGKIESKRDASGLAVASGRIKMKRSKKRRAADVKSLDPPVVEEPDKLKEDITPSGHEDIVLNDDKFHNDWTNETAEEEKALLQSGDPNTMLSEKCKSLSQDEAEMNIRDVISSSKCETGAEKVEGKRDASELAVASESRKTKRLKKHWAAAKSLIPTVNEEPDDLKGDITSSGLENIVLNDEKFSADQTDETVEEEKASAQSGDPKTMPSEKSKSLCQDEAEMNSRDVDVSSKLLDAAGILEVGDPCDKRRKKTKKSKNSNTKSHVTSSGMEHAKSAGDVIPLRFEPHKAYNSDHPSDESEKGDSILSQAEKTKVSKMKTLNTSLLSSDKEADRASRIEAGYLQLTQITKIQETADNSDVKVKKKLKKARTSTAKNLLDLPMKEKDVDFGHPAPLTNENKEENAPSKKTETMRSKKTSSLKQLSGSMLESVEDSVIRIECSQPHPISRTVGSLQIPLDQRNAAGKPLEAVVKDDYLVNGCTDEANNHLDVSKCETVKFIDYFVPSQGRREVVAPAEKLVDKEIRRKGLVKELKANKNTKKRDVHSRGTSPDLQNSLNSNYNQGNKRKLQCGTCDPIQLQGSLSKNEHNEPMPHPNRRPPIVARDKAKGPTSQDNGKFYVIPDEVSRPKIVNVCGTSSPVCAPANVSGTSSSVRAPATQAPFRASANASLPENSKAWSASSSSSKSSEDRIYQNSGSRELQSRSNHSRVAAGKASSKKIGEVLNSSNHEKSLLVMSGTIFKGSSSESSDDEHEVNNSEASTRTPSDNSSSSDNSEGENKANLHLPPNESYSGKSKENGGNNITKSQSSGPKNMRLDTILRSSSRYKKAKLTASQSQLEDTESQPIDFVLNSQADI
ncbi:hypothetical protein HHK36_015708 [Tetracentron sinense]|uniref:Uncharacterized protein n=1 Tax=Tetracentron sinense TaxID=13715 RepID=A0A834Z6N8_TETSI|nr:hypothetical protein HHK36_015708 [Tetracentron sinense]